jgi:hypothetical protein
MSGCSFILGKPGKYVFTIANRLFLILRCVDHTKPINLIVRISSTAREHRFSYAIGTLSLTADLSWLDLERTCIKLFTDHITQIDSPFDYVKSSIGCTANSLDTITLGESDEERAETRMKNLFDRLDEVALSRQSQ